MDELVPSDPASGERASGPNLRTARLAALDPDAETVAKELEVYSTEEAPPDYDLDLEVAGVEREADARGWERLHLVGYSGGGAAALAVVARQPDRVSSLALLEPAWAGDRNSQPGRGGGLARV